MPEKVVQLKMKKQSRGSSGNLFEAAWRKTSMKCWMLKRRNWTKTARYECNDQRQGLSQRTITAVISLPLRGAVASKAPELKGAFENVIIFRSFS